MDRQECSRIRNQFAALKAAPVRAGKFREKHGSAAALKYSLITCPQVLFFSFYLYFLVFKWLKHRWLQFA